MTQLSCLSFLDLKKNNVNNVPPGLGLLENFKVFFFLLRFMYFCIKKKDNNVGLGLFLFYFLFFIFYF